MASTQEWESFPLLLLGSGGSAANGAARSICPLPVPPGAGGDHQLVQTRRQSVNQAKQGWRSHVSGSSLSGGARPSFQVSQPDGRIADEENGETSVQSKVYGRARASVGG